MKCILALATLVTVSISLGPLALRSEQQKISRPRWTRAIGYTELRGHCAAGMDCLILAAAKVTEKVVLSPGGTRTLV
jgi:hypothetical protein